MRMRDQLHGGKFEFCGTTVVIHEYAHGKDFHTQRQRRTSTEHEHVMYTE